VLGKCAAGRLPFLRPDRTKEDLYEKVLASNSGLQNGDKACASPGRDRARDEYHVLPGRDEPAVSLEFVCARVAAASLSNNRTSKGEVWPLGTTRMYVLSWSLGWSNRRMSKAIRSGSRPCRNAFVRSDRLTGVGPWCPPHPATKAMRPAPTSRSPIDRSMTQSMSTEVLPSLLCTKWRRRGEPGYRSTCKTRRAARQLSDRPWRE
jgi:hypothetical protein